MKAFFTKFAGLKRWQKIWSVIGAVFVIFMIIGFIGSASDGTLGKPVGSTTASAAPTAASAAPTSTAAKPATAPATTAPKATTAPAPAPTSAAPVAPTSATPAPATTPAAKPSVKILCELQKTMPDRVCTQDLTNTQLLDLIVDLETTVPGIVKDRGEGQTPKSAVRNTCGDFYNGDAERARNSIAARFTGSNGGLDEAKAQKLFDLITTKYCPLSKRTEPAPGL